MGLLTTVADFMRQYHYFHGALHALERTSARQRAPTWASSARDLARLAWAEAERRMALEAQIARASVPQIAARQPGSGLRRPALTGGS